MTHRPVLSAMAAPLLTVLGFSVVINLCLLAPSIFMLQVFDRVLTTRSLETLVLMGTLAAATLLLMGLLEYLRTRTLGAAGVRLEQVHGVRLLSRLFSPGAQHGEPGAAAEPMRDLGTLRAFLGGPGIVALCDAPWIPIYLALIYLFHPALGLLATGCSIVLLALAWVNERLTRSTIDTLGSATRAAGRWVDATVRQADVVTALGMQPAVARRWQALNTAVHVQQLRLGRAGGGIGALSRLLRQMVQVLMLGYGAYLVIRDHATPGVTLAATIVLARALAPLEQLISQWRPMVDARAAYRRLNAALAQAQAVPSTDLPRPAGRLVAEDLGFSTPAGRPLLQGVSLGLAPGQVMALVGASGAGKTTLARLLAGVTEPSTGCVRLDDADLRHWPADRRGPWIGYVPQESTLFEGSVADNIARLAPGDSAAVLLAAQRAGAHEMLLRLPDGYDTAVGEGGRQLSGGQRQRVALARALYGDPALVVLDEPDASLDAEGERALLQAISGLRERGASTVVVTQRRALLSVADVVMVVRDGRIEPAPAAPPAAVARPVVVAAQP